jgi:hypothetical protein
MNQRLVRGALLLVALTLLPSGCKEKKLEREDEKLKAVVAEDQRLFEKERELLARRGSLQRERKRIQDKREKLRSKRATLPEDDSSLEALEQEESELAQLEAKLVTQEIGLNKKLQSLLDKKDDLVAKLAKDRSGAAREVVVSRREHSVALRERDLARREKELARREKELAKREQVLAKRQANLCPKAGPVQVVQAPAPRRRSSGASYTREDVEPVFRTALKAMRAKGILVADLPPGVDRLVTETRHGVAKGDFVRAKYAADQLLATVRKMKIDRSFIGTKISRLGRVIRRAKPSKTKQAQVSKLFQKATADYGDGKFRAANKKLNRIYSILH